MSISSVAADTPQTNVKMIQLLMVSGIKHFPMEKCFLHCTQ